MSGGNQAAKEHQQEEGFVLVDSFQDIPEQKEVPREKGVRVIREEIQLEEDEDDYEGDDVEGDMDDLLVVLPDDTEVPCIQLHTPDT